MIFKQTYNKLKILRKNVYAEKIYEISFHEFFYAILNKKINVNKNYNKFFSFIANLSLFFLSYLTIYKAKIFGIKKINYFIVADSNNIDIRSKNILNLLDDNQYINIVRTKNFKTSLKTYFKFKNIIFFNSLFIFYKFKKKDNSKYNILENIHSKNFYKYLILRKLFSNLGVYKFLMIDDYREMQIFIKICNELRIKSIGYQHSRFNKFLLPLKYECFDKYIVWTDFFKKKLLLFNKNYKNKILINNFRNFSLVQNYKSKNNLIYFVDDYLDEKIIVKYLDKLNKLKNFKLFVKLKFNSEIPDNFIKYLKIKNYTILPNISINQIIKTIKPAGFLAAHSNILMESTLFNIAPILLKTKTDYSYDLIDEKLVFHLNLKDNFDKKIKKFVHNKKKISIIRNKIWTFKNERINHLF